MKVKGNNIDTKISVNNLISFIEGGEQATILLNGKEYLVGCNMNGSNLGISSYYINETKFEKKADFLDYLYNNSAIHLLDEDLITVVSIADNVFINEISNKKNNLKEDNIYKNVFFRFIIISLILIFIVMLFFYRLESLEIKDFVIITIAIFGYIIVYFYESIKMLGGVILKRKSLNLLLNDIKVLDKENCFGNIYFFDNYLVKLDKYNLILINYEDIIWIFKEVYYTRFGSKNQEFDSIRGVKNYGEVVIVTGYKKSYKLGYITDELRFKNKILAKNSRVIFGSSSSAIKKVIDLYRLNVKKIRLFVIVKDYIKAITIFFLVYLIFRLL